MNPSDQPHRYLNKHSQTYTPDPLDTQAHRVYRFESDLCGASVGHKMALIDLKAVSVTACRTWKVKKPKLGIVSQPKARVYGWQTEDGIELNSACDGQNLTTLLHEMAHWIVHSRHYAVEDHGPEFMWIYIELLDQFKLLPRICALQLCDIYKIEVG